MNAIPPRQDWLDRLSRMTQQEKDDALFTEIALIFVDKVEDLIRAGAHTKSPPQSFDVLSWAVRRTEDLAMVNKLLDLGLTAEKVAFSDLEYCFYYDDDDKWYAVLARLTKTGFSLDERAKAAAFCIEKHRTDVVDGLLVKGEDYGMLISLAREYYTRDEFTFEWEPMRVTDLYDAHFAEGITAEKLRQEVTPEGMTGLMLAARARKFGAVVDFYAAQGAALTAAELLQKDRLGATVVDALGYRNMLPLLFAPALWLKQPAEASRLLSLLPESFRSQVDSTAVMRDIHQARFRDNSRNNPRLRL